MKASAQVSETSVATFPYGAAIKAKTLAPTLITARETNAPVSALAGTARASPQAKAPLSTAGCAHDMHRANLVADEPERSGRKDVARVA
jgi:hypothetical protein